MTRSDSRAGRVIVLVADPLRKQTLVQALDGGIEPADVTDRRGGPALIAQRCGGAPARCTAAAEIGFGDRAGLAAAAREAWRAVQGGALNEPPRVIGDIHRQPPLPSGGRWCRNRLVWAGPGAAVVTAVIVNAVTSGSRPPPIVTIDRHDFGR